VVQSLAPPLSRGDGYPQVFLDLVLPGEVVKAVGAEAGVKGGVLGLGLARNDALDFFSPLVKSNYNTYNLSQNKEPPV
jgi:hypothetical protein